MFPNFFGNSAPATTLDQLVESGKIPQTILLAGPEGIGKATLARRFAAALLGHPGKIEQDDLSLASNREIVADREKWAADKRNDDPLLFATHPDFVTFPPDGPLRQISIPQMRLVKELARLKPLHGSRRVFLIDHIDRANEQAANSLLKTLEEPPDHLVIVMTAQNPYDLLPTIRSRAVTLPLTPLSKQDMLDFLKTRGLDREERRLGLAGGSPGLAVSIDLESYDQRRTAMFHLLQTASRQAPFGVWARDSEALGAKKAEKLDLLLGVLYLLLEDVLLLANGVREIRNSDMLRELESLADTVTFRWIRNAVKRVDELSELVRRNIQKSLALDALAIELRRV
jgi:DNA polymerase-3 subunit delta'